MQPLIAQPVMTNVQVELLKVFAMQLPDEQLRELLMEKVNNHIDKSLDEHQYDEIFYEKLTTGEL
jgi:hypothetical protein